jgi:AAA domain
MKQDSDILPVVRAALLEELRDERRWLVDSLWARAGVGIIGGAPKCCKSWLGLDMALSVASATPCLGAFPVAEPGGVLIYMAEDSAAVVKARLAGLCRHRGLDLQALPIDVITAPCVRLDLECDQRRLEETVRRLAPRMLLLDPFVRLHRIDENHAGDVSAILAYLRALQRAHDVAVVVAHHARKNGPAGAQAGQGLRGSGDFHAWGDSNLYLRRSHGQLALTIEHRAASAPEPLTLALVQDGGDPHLQIVVGRGLGGATPDAPRCGEPPLDELVLRLLGEANSPKTRTELRVALRVRNERLGDALERLSSAGAIQRLGDRWIRSAVSVAVPVSSP